jgi:ferredoxin
MIRYVQLGLKDRMLEQTDPWLCYYCGECSDTCPRGAEPAEAMMTMRRWLTAQYDWSGHGAKLYTSEKAVWWTIIRVALVPLIGLLLYHWLTGFENIVTDQVALNAFAPVMIVWAFVLAHGVLIGYRLISSVLRMSHLVMGPTLKNTQIPFTVYLQEFKTLVTHFATQKRWRDCEDEDHSRWLKHLLLVSGYVIMLTLVVVFLWWFQTDNLYPIYHPQRWLGYYATAVLIYASGEALLSRQRRQEQIHRFSHPTDWLFPAFIFVGSVTGIFVHLFRYLAWPWLTYGMYTFHVMAMIAMLDTEVGIGKWTHLALRPVAVYLDAVKARAKEQAVSPGGLAPAD